MTEVVLSQLGETVTEGTILKWLKQPGESVQANEPLYEVSTDKVDTEVGAPCDGVVAEILVEEGATVEVGTTLAKLQPVNGAAGQSETESQSDTATPSEAERQSVAEGQSDTSSQVGEAEAAQEEKPTAPPDSSLQPASSPVVSAAAPSQPVSATAPPQLASPDDPASEARISPVVRRLLNKQGIDPSTISGTGVRGRITRKDAEAAIANATKAGALAGAAGTTAGTVAGTAVGATASRSPASQISATQAPTTQISAASDSLSQQIPLSRIRLATGEHMVRSKATSPHVLTAVEVDFESVERVRQQHRQEWRAAEGFSLTYLPFIARAVCDALADYPHINASISDSDLLVHHDVNLAVAVDLDFQGLLAPVVRRAQNLRLRAIARQVVDLSKRSRAKQLSPDELAGGTFTITNPGQWGTMMQFPIINQPQVAILSTDGISRKPVVVTDATGSESIAIHSVGVLALAWDHRAFDGAYVAAFLDKLRSIIQTRNWEDELS